MNLKAVIARCLLVMAIIAAAAPGAGAADGVVPIDQSKVLAAGGFPYKISAGGSYRLTGNLTVSGAVDGIDVVTPDPVTIDLNGFTIAGAKGVAVQGIDEEVGQLTLRNGTITGFSLDVHFGITAGALLAENLLIDAVNVGIQVSHGPAIINRVTFTSSATAAIFCGDGCVVSDCSITSANVGAAANSGLVAVNNTAVTASNAFSSAAPLAALQNHVAANPATAAVIAVANNLGGGAWGRNVVTTEGTTACSLGPISLGDNICKGVRQ
jgi:hypothetical protein